MTTPTVSASQPAATDARPAPAAVGGWHPWVVAIVGMFSLMMSNGLTATGITALDPALLAEFGWARADFKLRDALTFWIAGLLAPVVGLLVDRYNPKYLLMAGMLFLATGYVGYGTIANGGPQLLVESIFVMVLLTYGALAWVVLRSWVPALPPAFAAALIAAATALAAWGYATHWVGSALKQVYVIHLLFALAVAGSGGAVIIVLVSSWFVRHRGLALGIALVGTSLGSAVLPGLSAWLIEDHGWRGAFRREALLPLLLFAVILLLIRGLPRHAGVSAVGQADGRVDLKEHGMTFRAATRTVTFWAICLSGFLTYFAIFGFVQHLVLHMTRGLGFTLKEAASALLLFSLVAMSAKLLSGAVADRVNRHTVFRACLIVMFAGLVGLSTMRADLLFGTVVVIGAGWGGLFTLYSMLAVSNFGLREIGRINGVINLFETFGVGCGSWVVGLLYDRSGSYQGAFLMITAAVAIGFLLATRIRNEVDGAG
jgi:sugar phosphate permease